MRKKKTTNTHRELHAIRGLAYVRYRREQHVHVDARTQRIADFQYFLDEPAADAVSYQQHARRGAVRSQEFVEELEVRLDLSGERHRGRLGVGAVCADVRRQAEMRVGVDD